MSSDQAVHCNHYPSLSIRIHSKTFREYYDFVFRYRAITGWSCFGLSEAVEFLFLLTEHAISCFLNLWNRQNARKIIECFVYTCVVLILINWYLLNVVFSNDKSIEWSKFSQAKFLFFPPFNATWKTLLLLMCVFLFFTLPFLF